MPRSEKSESFDVLILSNGPGEVATWVRPVVEQLRRRYGMTPDRLRISLVLSPCPNATGQELELAQRIPGLDRTQGAEAFFPFLLWGKTTDAWDWRPRGLVLFLGGDQIFPVILGKRLGYGVVIYGEWEARWGAWVDRFGVMRSSVVETLAPAHRAKATIVGDLMADVPPDVSPGAAADSPILALLPGSKPAKLGLGLPFMLAVADRLLAENPQLRVWIPVAPTLTPDRLAAYGDPAQNPLISLVGGSSARLWLTEDQHSPYLETSQGVRVELDTNFPNHDRLRQSTIALTTVGANTAELGALGVPMVVIVPTQDLTVMRAWDGIPGLLVRLPLVGDGLARLINSLALKRLGLLAWPNIWAGRTIVPELVGQITPEQVAQTMHGYLHNPDRLQALREDLRQVRGEAGAAAKLVDLLDLVYQERYGTSP